MSVSSCHSLSLLLPGETALGNQIKIIQLPGIRARKLDSCTSSSYSLLMSHPVPLQEHIFRMEQTLKPQLSAFPNCLCPCVDCEDVIFLTPWVWLTHHMTQFPVPTHRPSSSQKPSALESQRLKVLLKLSWMPHFLLRKLMSRDSNGFLPAALGRRQTPGHPHQSDVLPTLVQPLLLMVREALSYVSLMPHITENSPWE